MDRISDRHEGDLGGRLESFDDTRPVAAAVVVAPQTAHIAAVQHTAWMMINLLARTDGIVETTQVVCPPDVPLAGRIVPLAPRDITLADALVTGGRATGGAPVEMASAPAHGHIQLVVGDDPALPDSALARVDRRYVLGHGWWGGVSNRPIAIPEHPSQLPFGPYIAAALAVGEVYLARRLPKLIVSRPLHYGWDSWNQTLTTQPAPDAPIDAAGADLSSTALAGVGAVGSTWVHALWATAGIVGDVALADADDKGVDITNLNRCPLFGRESLQHPKATEAARIAQDCALTWHPYEGRLEAHLSDMPHVLVSAVDTNQAREALQSRYAPAMLSGSTRDLRAEILRAGPPGIGACLRCYNPPEAFTGDDELRAQARGRGPDMVRRLALDAGVEESAVRRWLDRGHCDEIGTRLLKALHRSAMPETMPARFAVGFTSVLAGVLLAAETVKVVLGRPLARESSSMNNVTFQFFKPTASANAAMSLARDPLCIACDPTGTGTAVWRRRSHRLEAAG